MGLPGGSEDAKYLPAAQCRPQFDPEEDSLEKELATASGLLENAMDRKRLVSYSPQGSQEPDVTERLALSLFICQGFKDTSLQYHLKRKFAMVISETASPKSSAAALSSRVAP